MYVYCFKNTMVAYRWRRIFRDTLYFVGLSFLKIQGHVLLNFWQISFYTCFWTFDKFVDKLHVTFRNTYFVGLYFPNFRDTLYVFGGELSFCNDQETPLWFYHLQVFVLKLRTSTCAWISPSSKAPWSPASWLTWSWSSWSSPSSSWWPWWSSDGCVGEVCDSKRRRHTSRKERTHGCCLSRFNVWPPSLCVWWGWLWSGWQWSDLPVYLWWLPRPHDHDRDHNVNDPPGTFTEATKTWRAQLQSCGLFTFQVLPGTSCHK